MEEKNNEAASIHSRERTSSAPIHLLIHLFKRWIATIYRINHYPAARQFFMYFRETNCVIYWIVTYSADSVIHLLSNSVLETRDQRSLMSGNPCDKYGETFHSLNATGTPFGGAVLEQVTE